METPHAPLLVNSTSLPLPPSLNKLAALIYELVDERVESSLRVKQAKLQSEQDIADAEARRNEQRVDKYGAAAECQVTPQTIWTWYQRGRLKGAMVGNRLLFRLGDVRALLEAQTLPDGRRKYARRTAIDQKNR